MGAPMLHGARASLSASAMLDSSILCWQVGEDRDLRGSSVLLLVADQWTAALALIELDGVAGRIVLCPPELDTQHLPAVMQAAAVDVVVSDSETWPANLPAVSCRASARAVPGVFENAARPGLLPIEAGVETGIETEWVLLTSGTTGTPKLVAHTLASLAGGLVPAGFSGLPTPIVWSTFYDIRRYGGLQIFLRSVLHKGSPETSPGASLVLADKAETLDAFLVRAGGLGLTHISGTPSHWRRVLMSSAATAIDPVYVRLSGEIADQAILNQLRTTYPRARVAHAFASTEAGLVFEVDDGMAGFPAALLSYGAGPPVPGVELKINDQTLRVRSARTASRYLGDDAPQLKDAHGWVDTRDLLAQRDGRYHFVGRGDGVINVGGQKVHPEEVEAVLNRHPDIEMSLVWPKKSPITGALVVADVVLRKRFPAPSQAEILRFCREALAAYKVPVAIHIVSSLEVGASGKLARSHG